MANWPSRWGPRAAVLVLAFGIGACTTTASPPSVAPPTPSPTPAGGPVQFRLPGLPGTVSLLLPPGWTADGPMVSRASSADATPMSVAVWLVRDVYRDPCDWSAGTVRGGRRADTVADALAGQLNRQTRVSRVTIGEHAAVLVTAQVPEDLDPAGCDEGEFRSWPPGRGRDARSHAQPGERSELYIVQVGKRAVVIEAAYFDDADSGELAELHRIVASVTFGTPGTAS